MNRRSFITQLAAFAYVGSIPARASAQSPHTHQHSFEGAQNWAQVFDDPKRDAWQKPHEVIQALGLKPDAIVADIGAGTGYFSARLAHVVPKGRVLAVDTEPDMVRYLAERAKREGLTNMTAIAAKPDDPKLPEKADLALLVDVYHHIENRKSYFRRLAQELKSDGRVAVIDFRMDSPDGPPKDARIPPDRVKAELRTTGFEFSQEHTFLPNQFFLMFRRAGS